MTDKRPVWLLDFDGVLNAIASRGMKSGWDTWKQARIPSPLPDEPDVTYPILWAPEAVSVVADAVNAGVRVVWLTTWREDTYLLPLTLTELPDPDLMEVWDEDTAKAAGARLDPLRMLGQDWKPTVARALLPDDVPLLWTDDNLHFFLLREDRSWLDSRKGSSELIAPSSSLGLSRKQVKSIREWIDLVSAL